MGIFYDLCLKQVSDLNRSDDSAFLQSSWLKKQTGLSSGNADM
jgi:hypothetical protein